ncbi:methionine adenosyltransferase [Cupriavidus sp. Agwp_2]|uniref:methionine adenosyltransferase n=1 Tax=unclassified Cupriavidus TaxID=2640874 RepID=UPI00345FBB24
MPWGDWRHNSDIAHISPVGASPAADCLFLCYATTNDTSFGVGSASFSPVVVAVLSASRVSRDSVYRGAFKAAGMDFKIMGSPASPTRPPGKPLKK